MAGLADDFVEELKARVDIVELAGRYTNLKRRGRNWVGLSPFSDEKTPSFNVLAEKGIFKCFSTGLAGDIITLVREKERMEFVEAVEFIARLFNVPVRYREGGAPAVNRSLRREIEEIQDYAAEFFHERFLADDEAGTEIRRYWTEERRFDIETARDFRVGFAPAGGFHLNKRLIDKGFSVEALRDCGLFYTNESDRNPNVFRNRFRGRLMIPIRDAQGRIVAFTARVLPQTPESDPTRNAKYVNSPETLIFHKSRLLFNLDRARDHAEESGGFLMVEGQLDTIRCWSAGLRAAVAPQGTSVTEEQLALLRRYHTRVDILLDGDRAGRAAALRILPLAFTAGIEARFIALPPDADPDTFLLEKGAEAVEELRADAMAPVPFAVAALLDGDSPTPAERSRALQQVAEFLRGCESEVARSAYLAEAAELLDVDTEAALTDARRLWFRRQSGAAARAREAATSPKDALPVNNRLTPLENDLLWIILLDDRWVQPLALVVEDSWLDRDVPAGRVLGRILAEAHEGTWEGPENVDSLLETQEERNSYYSLAFREGSPEDPAEYVHSCVHCLAERFKKSELERLTRAISGAGPETSIGELLRRRGEVRSLTANIPFHLLHVADAPRPSGAASS
ncbi:MAG: DNA primase [Opitutales bacterium]|nr:DNA primase [Opitutales bacterium]